MPVNLLAAACGAAFTVAASGQPCCGVGVAEARQAAKAQPEAPRWTIEHAADLVGDWSAERPSPDGGSSLTQEVWSHPAGNNMMGMFRWVGQDGTAMVFEMLTITEEEGTLVLRLRHQDAAGNAWEAPDKPARLHLTEQVTMDGVDDWSTVLVFADTTESCDLASCEYEVSTMAGTLKITVRFDDPAHEDLVFNLRRGAHAWTSSTTPEADGAAGGTDEPGGGAGAAGGNGGREKAPGADTTLTPEQAREVFDRFAALEGEWVGRSTRGWEEKIIYQGVAGGSVVVERSFDAHPGEQMYTMVHMDGDRLMLTHYCIARNQPRLVCTAWEPDPDAGWGTATFEFLDATNLESRDRGHMDKVVVRFLDQDHFTSRWTWYEDGVESWMEEIEHERTGRQPGALPPATP